MHLLFTIPMISSVLTGFAIVFIYFPLWIAGRYALTRRRKTVAWFSLAGTLACLVFVVAYTVTRTEIVSRSMWIWPASIGLGALDPPGSATISEVILIYGLAILSNVGLYGWVGLLVGSVWKVRKGT